MQEMLCPKCGKGDGLYTRETMVAEMPCEAIYKDGPQYAPGKEIIYDSMEISGVRCECGWSCQGPDWINHLN